ncbi:MAG TPA: thioredoxin family protein [bacterium]|nr:thioredoxin family protein [bacterium]
MADLMEFNSGNWIEEVLKSRKRVLVEFGADWCEPCRRQNIILRQLAGELGDQVKIGRVDFDRNDNLAYHYQVFGIPALLVIDQGKVREFFEGVTDLDSLRRALKSPMV